MRLLRSARWLMLALLICSIPASSYAGVFISVNFGPPVLPVYVQPVCPEPNLIWTPGYWAYGDEGYFWVPGAWVPAPFVGGLWTPGYWGWSSGLYIFHPGYWGYHVGYYGGVNYGGGYLGVGFAGGEWRGGAFAYNTAVVNVNTTIIHNTFVDRTVVDRYSVPNPNHVAYAGGPGGIQHQPAPQEQIAERETHTPPTTFQAQHIQAAQSNKQSYAKANGGHPATLAVAKPLPVETHAAPPVSHTTMNTGVNANTPAAHGAPPNRPESQPAARTPQPPPARSEVSPRTPQPPPARPEVSPRTPQPPPARPEVSPRTPPPSNNNSHNTEMRPNTPPKNNPPPRPAEKPKPEKSKPEGREK